MKVFIDTLGCEKNTNDSQFAAGFLIDAGHEIVSDPYESDAILVITCAFIRDAKKQSIEHIFDMYEIASGSKVLAIAGCLSERYREELQLPEADILIGVNDYDKLPAMLEAALAKKKGAEADTCKCGDCQMVSFCEKPEDFYTPEKRDYSRLLYSDTLKIAEGCNNICTYCIIPYIRGTYRSKPFENCVEEAKRMAMAGVKELLVIAQDTTYYGKDLYGSFRLAELLRELCKIDGIAWIRLLYCYEESITDELIDVIASEDKICKYLDIPVQHSTDKILKAMNRRSTHNSIMSTIDKLRERVPGIHIRTTLITGFPGETKEDFEELCEFVETVRFDRLGAFAYSREEGTIAYDMKPQVRSDVKDRRANKIMEIQNHISYELNSEKIGSVLETIVEGMDEDGSYYGRSRFDAPDIDCAVLFKSGEILSPGDIVNVLITDAFDYDLVGEHIAS